MSNDQITCQNNDTHARDRGRGHQTPKTPCFDYFPLEVDEDERKNGAQADHDFCDGFNGLQHLHWQIPHHECATERADGEVEQKS